MIGIFHRLQGYVCLRFLVEKRVSVYNVFIKEGIASFGYREEGDTFILFVALRDLKKVSACLASQNLSPTSVEKRGLPAFLKNHTARVGLLVGAVLFILLHYLSSRVVWDIRVVGNQQVSDGEILLALENAGLSYGTYISNTDLDAVAIEVLRASEGLSWISINLKGTVAYIEVMEKEGGNDTKPQSNRGANLIAAEDAMIEEIEIVRGKVIARPGMSVKKGELLVSGILDGPKKTTFLRANGRVWGRVTKRFELEIPYKTEKKQYTEQKTQNISLNFFGFSINIFKDTRNSGGNCDTIDKRDRLFLPGGIPLPIFVDRKIGLGYESETATLTESEAVLLATRLLNERVASQLSDARILSRTLEGEFTENGYRAVVVVTCVMNIAQVRDFSVLQE